MMTRCHHADYYSACYPSMESAKNMLFIPQDMVHANFCWTKYIVFETKFKQVLASLASYNIIIV